MIAHIPLASHPNPTSVLVIGGGDGGVVREVLKHPSVTRVVLVDIDEAVIRVSKTYLPHMSSLLSDTRVTVHVGDGFAFLAEAAEKQGGGEGKYDVIITDSSDPVGPAASLFQKPYFELLRGALKEGGNISAQGECLWLHLPLIQSLRTTTQALFPVAQYAYTTIPTYPSGQIGFTLASTAPGRDLSVPLRKVEGTRYYNADVHRAAFVLPEFGRAMVEEGRNVLPVLKHDELASNKSARKILLLGSGAVALPCAEYVVRDPANVLTIGTSQSTLFLLNYLFSSCP